MHHVCWWRKTRRSLRCAAHAAPTHMVAPSLVAGKRFDGGDLPPNFVPQLTEHLFFQRFGGGAGQPQQQRKAGRSKPRRRPPGGGEEVEQDVSSQPSGGPNQRSAARRGNAWQSGCGP